MRTRSVKLSAQEMMQIVFWVPARCPHCASSLNNNVRAVLTFYLAGDFSPNLSKALSAHSLRFIGSRSEYLVLISMSSYIPPLSSSRYVRMKLSNQGL
jgi:hypothetical protein